MPTGNLLRQETVTQKNRPQLSELNSNDLRPMFTTAVARSLIVLDSSGHWWRLNFSVGSAVTLGDPIPGLRANAFGDRQDLIQG